MKVSREIKKTEAIKRMKILGIYDETIRQFENENLLSCSEPPLGANYWLDDEQKAIIKDIEEKYNVFVYFVVRAQMSFGLCDSFLCITDGDDWGMPYEDQWEVECKQILVYNQVFAYVRNYDVPEFSEFGTITVEPRFGGLVRVG